MQMPGGRAKRSASLSMASGEPAGVQIAAYFFALARGRTLGIVEPKRALTAEIIVLVSTACARSFGCTPSRLISPPVTKSLV